MEGGREQNYWPGFVDALSNVVLTLVFVLVIFVFALLMASNKVKLKMIEVQNDKNSEELSQAQLNQALAELEQLKSQENGQTPSCLRFNKSDATQRVTLDPDGSSVLILFGANAITVTDDTTKVIHDYIEGYRTKSGNPHPKFTIESAEDPTAISPLMAKETQLGRTLNVRNALLANEVAPAEIAIHNVAAQQQQDSYNWVKIYVEK